MYDFHSYHPFLARCMHVLVLERRAKLVNWNQNSLTVLLYVTFVSDEMDKENVTLKTNGQVSCKKENSFQRRAYC